MLEFTLGASSIYRTNCNICILIRWFLKLVFKKKIMVYSLILIKASLYIKINYFFGIFKKKSKLALLQSFFLRNKNASLGCLSQAT